MSGSLKGTSSSGKGYMPKHPNPASDNAGGAATDDPCWYTRIEAKPGDSRLGGDDPTSGSLYIVSCPDAIDLKTGNVVFNQTGAVWARNGAPPAPPPPNPEKIAQSVADQMTAPDPVVHFGPDLTKVAVKVPVWLWVDTQEPISFTLAVRGLSVTVTATLKSTTWSMGEPVDPADPSHKVASFECEGAGTPSPAHPDPAVKPPCGYTYIWKSLAERTNGSKTWPVTATTNWDVTWTASSGTGGALTNPLTPTTTQQVAVGEWRSNLVSGSGG